MYFLAEEMNFRNHYFSVNKEMADLSVSTFHYCLFVYHSLDVDIRSVHSVFKSLYLESTSYIDFISLTKKNSKVWSDFVGWSFFCHHLEYLFDLFLLCIISLRDEDSYGSLQLSIHCISY